MRVRSQAINDLSSEHVRSLLDYNQTTGEFRWLARSSEYFKNPKAFRSWNARYAGMIAGSIDSKGYCVIGIYRRHYLAHRLARLITTGSWPKDEIDHENRITADNRLCNLRDSSKSQNLCNSKRRSDNTT